MFEILSFRDYFVFIGKCMLLLIGFGIFFLMLAFIADYCESSEGD